MSSGTVAMTNLEGFFFNNSLLIALDLSHYKEKQPGRLIVIHLIGPTSHTFENERADAAYDWYLDITGQRKIQPVTFGKVPTLT